MPPIDYRPIALLTFLTIAAAGIALAVIVATYIVQIGPRRSGLAPLAASLAFVGPVCGIGAASKHLAQTFADMASTGSGGAAAVIAGCSRAENLMRLGDVLGIATLLLAVALGFFKARSSKIPVHTPAWDARSVVLVALLVYPVVVVGALHEYARATNRMAVAVAEAPTAKPGEPGEGTVVVQALATRMSRGILIGAFAVPALLLLLAVTAAISAGLAWRIETAVSFRLVGTSLLLISAAVLAVSILFFDRPVVLPL